MPGSIWNRCWIDELPWLNPKTRATLFPAYAPNNNHNPLLFPSHHLAGPIPTLAIVLNDTKNIAVVSVQPDANSS